MYDGRGRKPKEKMFETAVKILEATVGIRSNEKDLLPELSSRVEVASLLTDFRRVERIQFDENLDGYISIDDNEGDLAYENRDNEVFFRGPFSRLEKEASDIRYTLWGNQGFLYRFALYLLEKKHAIYNFHACALYQEEMDRLFVIIGGAGSGKTVFLLSGLEKGMKLFSSETVHFRITGTDLFWYMGSVVDNVRYGTLVHDFPRFLPSGDAPDPENVWHHKIAIDLAAYCAREEVIRNPHSVHILFPRIEKGFQRPVWNSLKNTRNAEKMLFDNITEKVAETTLLYDKHPVLGLDEKDLAGARSMAVKKLVLHPAIEEISSVLSGPENCWQFLTE
jgi:hypothetical protein